jgi:small conductance mechanosensitive channel
MNGTIMNQSMLLTKQNFVTTNPYLISIVIAIVIFISGLIIGRLVGKLINKLLSNTKFDTAIKKKTGIKTSIQKLIVMLIEISIYILFTGIALNYLGITSFVLNILLIAIIIILSISFMLALKDSIPNLIAGFLITRKTRLKIDDKIIVDSIEGKIIEMNFFEVRVEKQNGDIFYIPNSFFLKQKYVKINTHSKK